MDANEIDQYINQIAFSGARDFLDKYKDKTNDDQIIGHFWSWLLLSIYGC